MIRRLSPLLHPLFRGIAVLILLFAASSITVAQDRTLSAQPPAGTVIAAQAAALQDLQRQANEIEEDLEESRDSDETLLEFRLKLEHISDQLLKIGLAFRPRLSEINSRLEELGAAPGDGDAAESTLVSAERKALQAEKAEINVMIGKAEDLSIRVSQLIQNIAALRSDLFLRLFTDRYDILDAFGSQTLTDASEEATEFYRSVTAWLRFVLRYKFQAVVGATALALIAALVLLAGGRRLFGRLLDANPAVADPSYLTRLSVAFWSTLVPTLSLFVFFALAGLFFDFFNVLRGDIGVFLRALAAMLLIAFCVNRLARAALSPSLPAWRLIPVETSAARRLVAIATAMAVVLGASLFIGSVTGQLGSPLSVTIARSFIATLVIGLLLIGAGFIKPFRDADGERRRWPMWLRSLLFTIGGFIILAALLGYVGFANFLAVQIVVTGTLLLTAYIGFLSARALAAEGGFAGTVFGRRMIAKSGTSEATLDQLGLAAGVALNLMIVVIFLPLILLMWGFQVGDLRAWAYRLATGIQIGSISISVTGILSGILVFVGGYFLTRWFQRWLDGSVMARGRIDAGVRNSIRTVVGYAGLALAALIGISAAGLDLSSLALVAGGLSLGIGFGLQNVVSNFVSGLILLAERPFKAGDWIVAGQVSGTVKKISVRATEIETFQRQTVILPNSELINSAVGNWTHRNKLGRIEIKVNLVYGSDVRKAHALLLDIARSHPLVLKNPEPFVLFANLGPAALEFEMRVFVPDILNVGGVVQNELRMQIVEAFAREGLEIPSSPRFVADKAEPFPEGSDEEAQELHEADRQPGRKGRRRESRPSARGAK